MIRVVVTVLKLIVIDRASTMASSMKRAAAKSVSDVDVPQVRPVDKPSCRLIWSCLVVYLIIKIKGFNSLVRCGPPDPYLSHAGKF